MSQEETTMVATPSVKHWIQLRKQENEGKIYYTSSRPQGLWDYNEDVDPNTGYNVRSYNVTYRVNVIATWPTSLQLALTNADDKEEKHLIELEKETKTNTNDWSTYVVFEIKKTWEKRKPVTVGDYQYWITLSKYKPANGKAVKETSPQFTLVFSQAEWNGWAGFSWGSTFDIDMEDVRFGDEPTKPVPDLL